MVVDSASGRDGEIAISFELTVLVNAVADVNRQVSLRQHATFTWQVPQRHINAVTDQRTASIFQHGVRCALERQRAISGDQAIAVICLSDRRQH